MKFSLRDLLLVTVIVALAVGWWVGHRRSIEIAKKANAEIGKLKEHLADLESRSKRLREVLEVVTDKFTARLVNDGSPVTLYPELYGKPQALPNSSAPAPNPPKD